MLGYMAHYVQVDYYKQSKNYEFDDFVGIVRPHENLNQQTVYLSIFAIIYNVECNCYLKSHYVKQNRSEPDNYHENPSVSYLDEIRVPDNNRFINIIYYVCCG